MNPQIAETLRKAWPDLQALGVEHLDVFGSLARGAGGPDSDLDVLVYLRKPATLRTLVAIRDYLAVAVGRRVDVLTPGSLAQQPRLRQRILDEAVRVA